ncbi:general substrate transporter [Leptodontidium sp. 2 PMI_412]|nr:general substrate transporter [Leptodontidium sp. 2 PMI_412]
MKQYFGLQGKSLHKAIATLAGVGFVLFGYDQGVMSGLLTLDTFVETFPEIDVTSKHLTPDQKSYNSTIQGLTVAIYEIGCMFGALSTMWAGDKFGRRKIVFGGAIIMCIGAAIQCASFSLTQFIVGRIITGVGNGFVTATVPMWQSECAKAERRGAMVMIEGALIIFGLAFSYWLNFAFFFVSGQINWRFPIAFQCVFAGILIAFILELPESPRWLIKKGRIEESKVVFAALDGISVDESFVQAQVDEVLSTLEKEEGTRKSLKLLVSQGPKKHFHRSMLAIWSQAMQQLSGTNLITYYATSIYENSIGLSPVNARIVAACQNTAYVAVACIAIFTIERVGRRKLLLVGSVGQMSSMAILCGTVWLANRGNTVAGIVASFFIFFFNAFFGLGWLGIPWLYPAEIVSLEIRAPVNGLSTATDWALNFMVVMITPVAFNSIGVYTYVIFAAMNGLMFFVVYFLYPETANRSLEEIDDIFADSNPWTPWDVVAIARKLPIRHLTLDSDISNGSAEKATGYQVSEKGQVIEHTE